MSTAHDPVAYRIRGLAALAASLALVCAVFTFWPKGLLAPSTERVFDTAAPEVIQLEDIAQTVQAPPPPPPPPMLLPPVEVPDDVVIEVEELDFEEPTLDLPTDVTIPDAPVRDAAPAPAPAAPSFVERPQRSPVQRTMVFNPPREALRAGIRARVRVRVLVSAGGQVAEAEVIERLLLRGDDREEVVDEIGYGVEAAALEAAQRERFSAARHEGSRVRTYTTITYSVGV